MLSVFKLLEHLFIIHKGGQILGDTVLSIPPPQGQHIVKVSYQLID